jgi:hypothetical protein
MGLGFGFDDVDLSYKRKFRWLFKINGISAQGANALPHRRGSRPSLSWKEFEFQHLNETIYFPLKPDWKPIQLHLYDIRCNKNPVFDWVRLNESGIPSTSAGISGIYDPEIGKWNPVITAGFKRDAKLLLLGGCGETLEDWTIEGCYPQNIEWGELDMDNSDLITVDLTLRYDRAYIN